MQFLWGDTRTWLISGAILAGAIVLALVVHFVLFFVAERLVRRKGQATESLFAKRVKKSTRLIFPLLALVLAMPLAPLPPDLKSMLQHALGLGVIASIGWAIITASVMLMTFPAVRHLGVSLLASAGLAGLIVGMAARSTLSNLIAGIQVALTQPIRIEDAVVLEGEWGWIEEINTTYVVVRLWDLRRLVVPLSYFIEKPFQNWTRTRADLLATAMIYVDYTAPIQELREELHRILESTELWDKKTWALQVTDATERTIQIRALMSARNGPAAFDLRCYVREKLVQFLKNKYPLALPQQREQKFTAGQN